MTIALSRGARIGTYEIVSLIKSGGMASLYLAHRSGPAGFARHVAIKIVHPHLAEDPAFVQMFLDEARLCAQIHHPNVVHVEDLGEESGFYYLVMEYVKGCTLAQLQRRLAGQKRALNPELALHIAMRVADGLHAAHEAKDRNGDPLNVVHRDVSPQNILLSYDGHVKLIDFGVAKSEQRLTTTSSLKGKIRYMAPEQAWGRAVDRRTDVYALGVVLWEMMTRRRLFSGPNDFALLEIVRRPDVVKPSTFVAGLPSAVDELVLQALGPDPEQRFSTARAFQRAMGNALPRAKVVETDQLAALVCEQMAEERSAHASLAGAGVSLASESVSGVLPSANQPQVAQRVTGALTVFDPNLELEMGQVPPSSGSAQGVSDLFSAPAEPAAVPTQILPVERRPPRRVALLALLGFVLGLVALGIGGAIVWSGQDGPGPQTSEPKSRAERATEREVVEPAVTAEPVVEVVEPAVTAEPVVEVEPLDTDPGEAVATSPTGVSQTGTRTRPARRPPRGSMPDTMSTAMSTVTTAASEGSTRPFVTMIEF